MGLSLSLTHTLFSKSYKLCTYAYILTLSLAHQMSDDESSRLGVTLLMLYCVVPSLMGAHTMYPIMNRKKMKRIAHALRIIGIGMLCVCV